MAKELEQYLTNENFLIMLMLQLDVLGLISTQSLFYQRSGKSIIGEYSRQKFFNDSLEKLRVFESHHIVEFLKEVKCAANNRELNRHIQSKGKYDIPSCGTVFEYERCRWKAYKGKKLLLVNGNTPWDNLSSYINTYVDELKYQHEEWFLEEKDDLKHFDALDNNLWKYPSKNDPIPDEDDRSIETIAQMFGIGSSHGLGILWNNLKREIMKDPFFCEHQADEPEDFWASVLNEKLPNGESKLN